ncbi:MAG: hypothetical protein F4029_05370 [Gammaproteobacteria bacterium]|nr:hypothetical protein [Gammaproteobacteria bacterium]MYF29084.1 hypothetical protein [Gammaproteobacteria bacterium]MYK45637.1 hypothetical protein [Gammaproteobacteria bacterium]
MKRRTLTKLRKVFAEVVKEAQSNEGFAERLAEALGQDEGPRAQRSGRRPPGVLNPFHVLEETGRDGLRAALEGLDTERLKDIVAEHGMDPARLAMKWRKADRLVSHIVDFVSARDRKGDAFRAKQDDGAA